MFTEVINKVSSRVIFLDYNTLGSDRKNDIMDTSGWNEFPPWGGWAQP